MTYKSRMEFRSLYAYASPAHALRYLHPPIADDHAVHRQHVAPTSDAQSNPCRAVSPETILGLKATLSSLSLCPFLARVNEYCAL